MCRSLPPQVTPQNSLILHTERRVAPRQEIGHVPGRHGNQDGMRYCYSLKLASAITFGHLRNWSGCWHMGKRGRQHDAAVWFVDIWGLLIFPRCAWDMHWRSVGT